MSPTTALVQVMPSQNVKSGTSTMRLMPLGEALNTVFESDAMIVAYYGQGATPTARMRKGQSNDLQAQVVFIDVDNHDQPSAGATTKLAWDDVPDAYADHIGALVEALMAGVMPAWGVYFTRNGLRLFTVLPAPIPAVELESAMELARAEVAELFELVPDEACRDWPRLFRAPHVKRSARGNGGRTAYTPPFSDTIFPTEFHAPMATEARHEAAMSDGRARLLASGAGDAPMVEDPGFDYSTLPASVAYLAVEANFNPDMAGRHNTNLAMVGAMSGAYAATHDATELYAIITHSPGWRCFIEAHEDPDSSHDALWAMIHHCYAKDAPVGNVATAVDFLKASAAQAYAATAQAYDAVANKLSTSMGVPYDVALTRLFVGTRLTEKTNYYVWNMHTGRYEGPVGTAIRKIAYREAGLTELNPDHFSLGRIVGGTPTKVGRFVEYTMAELFELHGVLVDDLVMTYEGRSYADVTTRTLFLSHIKQQPDLFPEYSAEVSEYLGYLAGLGDTAEEAAANKAALEAWLAWVPEASVVLPAILLIGGTGIGKTLLASGLARLWNAQGTAVAYATATAKFNYALASSPIVEGSEITGDLLFGTKFGERKDFRLMTGSSAIPLEVKGGAVIPLINTPRILLSANNDTMFQGLDLSHDDVQAIGRRVSMFHPDSAKARAFLVERGRTQLEAWVAGGAIARHVLWLAAHRRPAHGVDFGTDSYGFPNADNATSAIQLLDAVSRDVLITAARQTFEQDAFAQGTNSFAGFMSQDGKHSLLHVGNLWDAVRRVRNMSGRHLVAACERCDAKRVVLRGLAANDPHRKQNFRAFPMALLLEAYAEHVGTVDATPVLPTTEATSFDTVK